MENIGLYSWNVKDVFETAKVGFTNLFCTGKIDVILHNKIFKIMNWIIGIDFWEH